MTCHSKFPKKTKEELTIAFLTRATTLGPFKSNGSDVLALKEILDRNMKEIYSQLNDDKIRLQASSQLPVEIVAPIAPLFSKGPN